jgi:phosphatidylserine/phosphatidylglycerophosphate/cardiolipin synthase-like enzyme
LLHLRSSEIAEDYQVEFNEMFQEDLFGTDDLALTPNTVVQIGDSVVEIYFSPDDNVQNRLLELLESAEESIYFLAYSFTADPLGEAIRSRAAAGVTVAGVMENDQVRSNSGTEYDPFQQAGLDVRLDTDDSTQHNKIIIIDEHIVVTGSYNFSSNAEEINDENVVIIINRGAAAVYLEEFWRIFTQALQPQDISEG